MSATTSPLQLRLRVGEACQLFGMTPRAIRFYEERGLITARRDPLNQRFYDGEARKRLAQIARLRAAGIGLKDIRDVLAAEDLQAGDACALDKLRARRAALREELARVEQSLAAMTGEDRHAPATRPRLAASA